MPTEDKQRYIREFTAEGFIVLSEVGSKDPSQAVVASKWADEMLADLGHGAALVIAEGRESGTVGLYDAAGQPDRRLVGELAGRVPVDRVLFEAPRKDQQAWFIRELGSNVNLGNIPPNDVLTLETLRTGLRADTVQLLGPAQDQRTPVQRNESPGWPPGIH
jgi:phosphosulfolactate synthase